MERFSIEHTTKHLQVSEWFFCFLIISRSLLYRTFFLDFFLLSIMSHKKNQTNDISWIYVDQFAVCSYASQCATRMEQCIRLRVVFYMSLWRVFIEIPFFSSCFEWSIFLWMHQEQSSKVKPFSKVIRRQFHHRQVHCHIILSIIPLYNSFFTVYFVLVSANWGIYRRAKLHLSYGWKINVELPAK